MNVDFYQIRQDVERLIGKTACMAAGQLPLAPRSNIVIEFAMQETKNLKQEYAGTEHLLLGLLREKDGIVFNVLKQAKVNYADARREVLQLLGLPENVETPTATSMPDRSTVGKQRVEQQIQEIQLRRLKLAEAILEQEQELLTVVRKRTELEREFTTVTQRRVALEQRLTALLEKTMEIEKLQAKESNDDR
jgi:ATP-dependent Clp protease ATP-binding subunit ClpC